MSIFKAFYSTLVELADSKKAVVVIGGILASGCLLGAKRLGIELDPETAKWLAGTVMVGVVAYAHAQAKVDAQAGQPQAPGAVPNPAPTDAALDALINRVQEKAKVKLDEPAAKSDTPAATGAQTPPPKT